MHSQSHSTVDSLEPIIRLSFFFFLFLTCAYRYACGALLGTGPVAPQWTDMADMGNRPVDVYLPSKLNCIDFDFIVERCGRGCGCDCEHSNNKSPHLGGSSAAARPLNSPQSPEQKTATGAAAAAALHGTLTVHCMPSMTLHGRTVSCVRGRIEAVYYKAGRRMATVEWGLIRHPHTGRLEQPRRDANVRPHFFHQGAFRLMRQKNGSDHLCSAQPGSGSCTSACAGRDDECESKDSSPPLVAVAPRSVKPSDLVVGAIVEKDWLCSDFHAEELFPSQKPSGFTVSADQRTRTLTIEVALPAPPPCLRANRKSTKALHTVPLVPLAPSAKTQKHGANHFSIVDDVFTVEHVLDFYRGGPGAFADPIAEAAAVSTPEVALGVEILEHGVPEDFPGGGGVAAGGAARVSVDAAKPALEEQPTQPVIDPQEHFFWARVASILADTFRVGDVVLSCHARQHRGNGENSEVFIDSASASCVSECLRQHFWFNGAMAAAPESSNCEPLVFTVQRTVLVKAVSVFVPTNISCVGCIACVAVAIIAHLF